LAFGFHALLVVGLFLNGSRALLIEGEAWSQPDLAAFLAAVRLKGSDAQPSMTPPRWQAAGRTASAEVDVFTLPPAEAQTQNTGQSSFIIADRDGNVVSCALNMGHMFGSARVVDGRGYLKAAADASAPSNATAVLQRSADDRLTMAAVAGASGFEAVQKAVQSGAPDRVNGWRCPNGLLSAPAACEVSLAFPGEGYAVVIAPDAPM
jgi:hypothetical protein